MSTLKTYNLTLDITTSEYATGDKVLLNMLDVNAYKAVVTVTRTGTPIDLATETPTLTLDGVDVTINITDAANGVFEVEFNDLSGFVANSNYKYLLKLTQSGIERNYKAFTTTTYTLP